MQKSGFLTTRLNFLFFVFMDIFAAIYFAQTEDRDYEKNNVQKINMDIFRSNLIFAEFAS